ncbi:hypothetical protein D3C71_1944960 [compost metagenome]
MARVVVIIEVRVEVAEESMDVAMGNHHSLRLSGRATCGVQGKGIVQAARSHGRGVARRCTLRPRRERSAHAAIAVDANKLP